MSNEIFVALWIATGIAGALVQRRWYKRRGLRQDTPHLDFAINVAWGPIGLIASVVAYT